MLVVADGDCDDRVGLVLYFVEGDGDVVILECGEQRAPTRYEPFHQLIK